ETAAFSHSGESLHGERSCQMLLFLRASINGFIAATLTAGSESKKNGKMSLARVDRARIKAILSSLDISFRDFGCSDGLEKSTSSNSRASTPISFWSYLRNSLPLP